MTYGTLSISSASSFLVWLASGAGKSEPVAFGYFVFGDLSKIESGIAANNLFVIDLF
jgi:hypothetical protein